MLPYDRFLLAVVALPLSVAERLLILQRYFCAGMTADLFLSIMRDILSHPEADSWGDEFISHLEESCVSGQPGEGYVTQHASSYLMRMELVPAYRALVDTIVSVHKEALQWLTRRIHYRALAALSLANQTPIQIASSMTKRFSKEITEDIVIAMQWMFFRFEDMTESEIVGWADLHPPTDRILFRMAMTEPAYIVYDHLGMATTELGMREVAGRIMHRGMSHFEKLSRVNHHKAFSEARKWGDLAMKAAAYYEKVKGGEYVDFLARFQVALMEADTSVIPLEDGSFIGNDINS